MKRLFVLALATFTLSSLAAVALPGQSMAQRRASLEEGSIVRRQLLYRSSRFELQPRIGGTLNDSFKRNLLVGVDLNYYLTNKFGLGVGGSFGALSMDTDLLAQINGTIDSGQSSGLALTVTTALFDAHLTYVPIFGKFAVFKSMIVDYDLHLMAGFGGALLGAEGNTEGEELSGLKPGPMLGLGFRLFVADNMAITVDLRDYIFSSADVQEAPNQDGRRASPVTELRNNIAIGFGFSLFFPGEVPISR
jgi:outer membrane beta-barrel protein